MNNIDFKMKSDDFNKSIHDFIKLTKNEDLLAITIRAHLYLEKELNKLIVHMTLDSKKLLNINFSLKLDIVYAFGGLEKKYYFPVKKFNSIRNQYAHKLDYNFLEKDYNDLLATFSKDMKTDFLKILKEPELLEIFFSKTNEVVYLTNLSLDKKYRILLSQLLSNFKITNLDYISSIAKSHMDIQLKNLKKRKKELKEIKVNNAKNKKELDELQKKIDLSLKEID